MNETQAARLIVALERIATSLEALEVLADVVDEITQEEGTVEERTVSVINIWKEGETE
jgi:hypothetical protein